MSIDSCYEGVIAKLTKQKKIVEISNKLLSLKTNAERALFVYDIIEELKAFPKVLQVQKSQAVSAHYRNLGNQFFQKSEDYKAWQYYNLSLLNAPVNKDDMVALAISNRSAVFYSMKKYKECLADIDKVLSMKYPGRLKDKLMKRKTGCEENIVNDLDDGLNVTDLLLMTSSNDPTYLCASHKLEVVSNKEMGRHVIAKEDIKVGEVLAQEDPYLILLLKTQILFTCSYCLSRNLNLIACDRCCFAMYCSDDCKQKAWQEYHEIECPLMATLIHMEFTKLELLALRTVIKSRTDHDSWNSLFKTIEQAEATENTEHQGCVKIEGKWIYSSKYYPSIHTLASNVERRSISDIFQKSVTAAVLLRLLEKGTKFLKSANNNEDEVDIRKCVAGNLLHHDMTCPTNMHGISANMETGEGSFVDEVSIASAPYAFHSLLNHSCSPNVVRFTRLGTGQMTLLALRPIKKGMQLFDNYGPHHALEGKASRQSTLRFQYKFSCTCEACTDDWPLYFCLQEIGKSKLSPKLFNKKHQLLAIENINLLKKGDKKIAFELFKPLCELAEELEPFAPCKELAESQEALKQCLHILGGVVTYGCSQLVDWKAIPPKV